MDDDVGDVYYQMALNKVLKIREERKEAYGNSWLESPSWETTAMIMQKARRLKAIVIDKQGGNYEKIEDCCCDLANWALFMLANDLREHGDSKNFPTE
jgi:hypothetical protein